MEMSLKHKVKLLSNTTLQEFKTVHINERTVRQEFLAFFTRVNRTDVTQAVLTGPAFKMVGPDMPGSLNPCGLRFFHYYMRFFSMNDINSDCLLIKSTGWVSISWCYYSSNMSRT